MTNPLLKISALPEFSKVQPKYIKPAVESFIQDSDKLLDKILSNEKFSWDNLLQKLEENETKLQAIWSPVRHLNSVMSTPELRASFESCLPLITEFYTKLGQNKQLLAAVKQLKNSEEWKNYNQSQRKIIDNSLRDFKLCGIDLSKQDQEKFRELEKNLSAKMSKFGANVLDATNAWYRHTTDENELVGIPPHAIQQAKEEANQRNLSGWVFTLAPPVYTAVMQYADYRPLREDMYVAFVTRASDQSTAGEKWDNSTLIDEIIDIRHQLAKLLGFANYTELSLATKMANSSKQVMDFLTDLATHSYPVAKREFDELTSFAQEEYGIDALSPWDVAYYSEKLRKKAFDIDPELLRPYFPEDKVLKGLFSIIAQLYSIKITEKKNVSTWHKDVKFFEISDHLGQLRGQFYIDLYARPKKQAGAWVDECRSRCRFLNGKLQTPVGFLVCNFNPPHGDMPALFSHNEVITLFHEFGHNIHNLLTLIDYPSIAGINGVPWDAVEFPSQLLENWCWQRESLNLISGHYKTGEVIPDDLYRKMINAKNFQAGMLMVRQLEFALFDFRLHLEYDAENGANAQAIIDSVRQQIAVVPVSSFNRFQNSFSHIFDGGYAAGYYSYKWAEVLACDAFSKFEEQGILNKSVGKAFMHSVLEQGGSQEPIDMFIEFMGREPNVEALLRHSGIIE
jgi:oligopeptidase A